MASPWTVPVDPALIGVSAALIAAVLLARRGAAEAQSRWRLAALAGAAVLLLTCWLSPLQTLASQYLLTAHLLQICLVMGVIPPLLLLALPSRSVWSPPAAVRRSARLLTHPVAGMIAVNAAFFVWHAPAVYDRAQATSGLYAAQQISLLLASVMFWWPIVVPLGGRRVISRWTTLGYILVATIPQTFAGITVAMAKHPLFAGYATAPRLFGLEVMTDQQIAGACTALLSKVALFAAFSVVFMRLLTEPAPEGGDDGGGGGGRRPSSGTPSPQPSGSVSWLADINSGRTVPEPAPRRVRVPAGSGSGRG